MSASTKKKVGTKILAWILIAAMIITFVCAIVAVLVQQYNFAKYEPGLLIPIYSGIKVHPLSGLIRLH